MRRTLTLATVVAALGIAVAGCGGEEEATPTPDTVTGATPTETQPTETTPTETSTDTGGTETTATETTPTETEPGAGEGDAAAGKQIFITNCGGCHTLSDAGTSGTVGPNLDDVKPSFDKTVEQVTNGGGAMPPFKGTLSDQQIADVSAYVSQTAGS